MIFRVLSQVAGTLRQVFGGESSAPVVASSRLGDLLAVPQAWQLYEGFHQPVWTEINARIKTLMISEVDRQTALHDASVQWLNRLKGEMGDRFRLGESRHFLLVAAKSDVPFRYFLGQCESALVQLRARLGEAAWRWPHGKHAVLMFEDEDDYYRYISYFHPDGGAYGFSSGMCLRGGGYVHTVLAPQRDNLPTLVHELVHLCLTGRRLPVWLDEGLATHLERELTGRGAHRIDKESIAEQRACWNSETIQRFWSGESFRLGDERTWSYGLAEHLVALLSREFGDLGAFIGAARREDAGQAAARTHLDVDLSDVAAAFLGEGDWQWRPVEPGASGLPE